MDDEVVEQAKPVRDEVGGWGNVAFYVAALAVLLFGGDALLTKRDDWWLPWAIGIGFLVLVNGLIGAALGTYHRRKLTGKDVDDKVTDQLTGFWFGLIKWAFIAFALFGAYRAYEEQFVPASSTNKLLTIVCIILVGIFLALLRVGDILKKR